MSALHLDAIATPADARARRRGRPAPASLDDDARAFAFALGDNHRCTSADGEEPNAQAGTMSGTQRNIVEHFAASSRHAYRTALIDGGGSFLASRPGSVFVSAEEGETFDHDSMIATAMCSAGVPVELEHIVPGEYRVCTMSADCTPITVRPSPDRQTFKVP